MTRKPKPNALSRRERQIMDILYKPERASVGHVLSNLADKPSYSTVRAQLRVLRQGHHSSRVCLDNRNRTAPAFLRPTPSRLGSCYSRFTRASFPRAAASRVALLRARQRRRSVEPRAREYSEFKLLRDSFHHY